MGGHRRLAGYVVVDGTPYGPDDDLPECVAVRITNPAAWESHPYPAAVIAPPASVAPVAEAPDPPTVIRADTAVPDAAVPDVASVHVEAVNGGAVPVTPDPVVLDEPTVTPDETASTGSTAPGPDIDEVEVSAAVSPPPRSGKGSGIEAWRSYARALHVPVPDGAERADIIAACEKAGHLPPQ